MYYFSPAAGTGWHTYKPLGWEVMHQDLSREASETNRSQKSGSLLNSNKSRRSFADVSICFHCFPQGLDGESPLKISSTTLRGEIFRSMTAMVP